MGKLDVLPDKQSCDGCGMCCKLLGVQELSKPADVLCASFDKRKGCCSIYEQRPEACRLFACCWIDYGLGQRPDEQRAVIWLHQNNRTLQVHLDTAHYPSIDAVQRVNPALFELAVKAMKDFTVIFVRGDRRRCLNPTNGMLSQIEQRDKALSQIDGDGQTGQTKTT